jgi:hypothetical protein
MRSLAAILLTAIGCAAEPMGPSLCDRATATLERCAGQVPEGFSEACEADPATIANSVLSTTDAETCPDPAKSDLGELAFVDACVGVLNAAYWVVWARSPSSQPLSRELRDHLRPWFGDLVDTTRVSWNASLLTRWRVLGREVVFHEGTVAQTFGKEIFIREAPIDEHRQIALIGHELAHAGQYAEYGGISGFAREYCAGYYQANFSYRNNALEVEAYDLQYRIKACLDTGQGCPN